MCRKNVCCFKAFVGCVAVIVSVSGCVIWLVFPRRHIEMHSNRLFIFYYVKTTIHLHCGINRRKSDFLIDCTIWLLDFD